VKPVLLEALVVTLSGAIIAFGANAISPRGLKLTRNYFPKQAQSTNQVHKATQGTNASTSAELLAQKVKELGFQLIDTRRMMELFKEPGYEVGQIAFIDAREDGKYEEGHIPGAYEFDYYHPEEHLPTVLPICQIAQQIVIYCNGGDCDDSLLAAVFLRDSAQVPAQKISIYAAGFTGWSTNGVPVELGTRKSGTMRNP
jgi:rhodanese-related sulfurtransferase